jgi:hypothetical protein
MNIQVHIYDVDLLHSLLSVPFLHKVTSTSYQRTVPYPHVDDMTISIKAFVDNQEMVMSIRISSSLFYSADHRLWP